MNREAIYFYAIKYCGNFNKIRNAINNNEDYLILNNQQDHIIYGEDKYPKELYMLEEPPYILFYKGNISLLSKRKISIVGSRLVSEYSKKYTKILAKALSQKYIIVSGMAKGTDCIAQVNSLQSIGVLGNGLDIVYPKENEALYQKIRETGLLISEYPLGVKPSKENFPFRNRIIAALGEFAIVPSARVNGGTFITIDYANRLNKDVYVLPHNLDNLDGMGCNRLIQDGANVIYDLEVLENL